MANLPGLQEDWQSVTQVPQCFWRMFEDQVACDVVFLLGVNQERIGAHAMVLMSRSSVFFRDFSQGIPDKEIFLPEVEPDDFRAFMRVLYTGETDQLTCSSDALMKIAEDFNVADLLKTVLNTKLHNMNIEEFCPFVKRYQTHMCGAMKFKCLEFVFTNPKEVFESEHFHALPMFFLQDIMQSKYLVLDEETICTALLFWATKACEVQNLAVSGDNQRKVLGNLLYEIRFPILNKDFFTDKISEKGLLTSAEEVPILKQFLTSPKVVTNLQFKFEKRCTPNVSFTYMPEEIHHVEAATGGPDITKGTIRPNESIPILRSLHSGRQGIVERFTELASGWGNSGKRADAIAFSANKDIRIDYVFVYGNYKKDGAIEVSLVLRDNHTELSKTTIKVQCTPKTPYYEIGIENEHGGYGIHLQTNQEYHIILGVKGDFSYYGKQGHSTVQSEDVVINFRDSKYSKNKTTVQSGQIAGFRFTVLTDGDPI